MDSPQKKRRDTSRFVAERGIAQALRVIAPALAGCNSRLARCRAVSSLSRPGYADEIRAECQSLRREVATLRAQLQQIVSALPAAQQGNNRIRDARHALDSIEIGVEGVLETVAADQSQSGQLDGRSELLNRGSKSGDRQGGASA